MESNEVGNYARITKLDWKRARIFHGK
jgi:hypothetical protein